MRENKKAKLVEIKQSVDQLTAHYGENKELTPEEKEEFALGLKLTMMSNDEVKRLGSRPPTEEEKREQEEVTKQIDKIHQEGLKATKEGRFLEWMNRESEEL